MNSIQSWYEKNHYRMSGGGLWFSGKGFNILPVNEWEKRRYRVLVVRLSTFRDTEASFTHQLIYQIAAGCDDVFVDCAWLPPFEDSLLFDENNIPWMTGVVSKCAASEFDCIAFSHSIVQETVNIHAMLQKSNIPVSKAKRMQTGRSPLVILGGANALFNGILLNQDPCVDVIFTGEDTASIRNIFCTCAAGKRENVDRSVIIDRLSKIDSVIIPDNPVQTSKPVHSLLKQELLAAAPVFFGNSSASASLMISEGCPCLCSFCAESWSRKPYRELPLEQCLKSALQMKVAMGLEKIDVYSFNFNMHEDFKKLIYELSGYYPSIGLKSQRLDGVAKDPEMMKLLHVAGKSSITVGIEGISARLRSKLQKSLDDETIRSGLTRIVSSPLRELKLFFIATGEENEVDFEEFRNLMVFISDTLRNVGKHPRIIVSMTPLVRFPFTPLQHEAAPEPETVQKILLQCERIAMAKRFEFRTASDSLDYLFSQIVLRPVSAEVGNALSAAVKLSGCIYYREFEHSFIKLFLRMLEEKGITLAAALKGDTYVKMPVSLPVREAFVETVTSALHDENDLGYCLGDELTEKKCLGCAACEDDKQISSMISQRKRQQVPVEIIRKRLSPNREFVIVQLKVAIADSLRGVPRNEIAARISCFLMRTHEILAKGYCGFAGTYVYNRTGSNWLSGDDYLYLKFAPESGPMLERLFTDAKWLAGVNKELNGFSVIKSIGVQVVPSSKLNYTLSTSWETDPVRYLGGMALKYTLDRRTPGTDNYLLSKESLKKKIVRSLSRSGSASGYVVHIEADEKFSLTTFMEMAVLLSAEHNRYEVMIETTLED